jgi:hypothetical protein
MLDELSIIENVFEEVLTHLMTKRVMSMSIGVQASSMRGLETSLSTTQRAGPS